MTGHPVAESFATARAANIMRRHIRHELRALKPTRPRSFPRRNPQQPPARRAGPLARQSPVAPVAAGNTKAPVTRPYTKTAAADVGNVPPPPTPAARFDGTTRAQRLAVAARHPNDIVRLELAGSAGAGICSRPGCGRPVPTGRAAYEGEKVFHPGCAPA